MEILGQGAKNEGSVKMALVWHTHIIRKKGAKMRQGDKMRLLGQGAKMKILGQGAKNEGSVKNGACMARLITTPVMLSICFTIIR